MPDKWKEISDLYHAALKLPESEGAAFLQACITSDAVREEVESLLADERAGEHLLKSPANRTGFQSWKAQGSFPGGIVYLRGGNNSLGHQPGRQALSCVEEGCAFRRAGRSRSSQQNQCGRELV